MAKYCEGHQTWSCGDTCDSSDGLQAPRTFPDTGSGFIPLGDSMSYSIGANGSGWPELACAFSSQKMQYLRSAAVGGNSVAMMLRRINTDILPYSPAVVSILGGGADLVLSSPTTPLADLINTHRQIVNVLRANRILPVLVTIPPQSTTTYLTNIARFNNYLRAEAITRRLPLLDFWTLLADPSTSCFAAGNDIGDGLHPSQAAHLLMAAEAQTKLIPFLPPHAPMRAIASTDPDNLATNPLFLAGSPTPTGWAASGTAMTGYTETVVNDAQFLGGKAYEWAFNNPTNAAGFRALGITLSVGAANTISVGDTLLLSVRARVISSTTPPGLNVGLRFQAAYAGGTPSSDSLTWGSATPTDLGLYQWRVTIPPGTTLFQLNMIVATIPTTTAITARVGEIGIYNLTKMGLPSY